MFRQSSPGPGPAPPSGSIGALLATTRTTIRLNRRAAALSLASLVSPASFISLHPPPAALDSGACFASLLRLASSATGGASATEPQAAFRLRSLGRFRGLRGCRGGVNPEGERSEPEACVGVAGAGETLD